MPENDEWRSEAVMRCCFQMYHAVSNGITSSSQSSQGWANCVICSNIATLLLHLIGGRTVGRHYLFLRRVVRRKRGRVSG